MVGEHCTVDATECAIGEQATRVILSAVNAASSGEYIRIDSMLHERVARAVVDERHKSQKTSERVLF